MNQAIELTGIVRNMPDNRVADGAMQELINLRPKDGAFRPVGLKLREASTPTDVRFIHSINETYKVIIGTSGGYLAYWVVEDEDITVSSPVTTTIATNGIDLVFAQLHRSLLIGDNTNKSLIILLFDVDTEEYIIYDDGLPELPLINFVASAPLLNYPYTNSISATIASAAEGEAQGLSMVNTMLGSTFTGPVAIRMAWELEDGSIVKPSAPFNLMLSTISLVSTTLTWDGKHISAVMVTSNSDLDALGVKWKGIIKSLNIYCTRQQTLTKGSADFCPVFKDLSLEEGTDFYLIKSFPVEENFSDVFPLINNLVDDFRDLETKPSLPSDNFTHHRIHGSSLFAYNDRIFINDITTKLYEGYSVSSFLTTISGGITDAGTSYDVHFEVDIQTGDGKKIVRNTDTMHFFKSVSEPTVPAFMFKRYFAYPDARATTLRIYIETATDLKLIATLSLTPNEMLNMAIYNKVSASLPVTYGDYTYTGAVSGSDVLSAIDDTYNDKNRIQATELSNPFYYPAINSYRVGNGRVLGLSTNALAISAGQFGEYPLFCFTEDGIWALMIGNGEVLISSIKPLSRKVCNNPASLTMIDGGTVFTTEKGLWIISGASPIEIGSLAEGRETSKLFGNADYANVGNDPATFEIKDFLCGCDFLDYIAGAIIAWEPENREIILSNNIFNYSWVYSVDHKMWYKISEVWDRFISDFPVTYGYRTIDSVYNQCNLCIEDYDPPLVTVYAETRPLKLSPSLYKKIERLVVGGYLNEISNSGVTYPFSLTLFGSSDGNTWYLLNASNTFLAQNRLIIGRSSFSCQYFILIIGGQVDEHSFITHIEAEFTQRYDNKLR